jgi:ATP-dependent helicase HrpB
VLLPERGLGGNEVDLEARRDRWRRERGLRAEAARRLARNFLRLVGADKPHPTADDGGIASAIALAFPDRLARRRDSTGALWASVGGRGFRLDPASPLAKSEWLAVAETQGSASGARIISAAAMTLPEIETLYPDRIETKRRVTFNPDTGAVEARRTRSLGAITVASGPDNDADPLDVAAALVEAVRTYGLTHLSLEDRAHRLRERALFAGIEVLTDEALIATVDEWFPALVQGKRRLSDVTGIAAAFETLLGWEGMKAVNALAPEGFRSPAGTSHIIDYAAAAGPTVELRVQALFGVSDHPIVGTNRVPLILSLTSPAGKPIQTTRDLPGFWTGSWADVAKEMRGRYPRHNWPDDPTNAVASLKTKNALAKKP